METAVRLFIAGVAAVWASALYALLRLVSPRVGDAVVVSLVGLTSASALCWLPVAERYPLGSVSIVAMLVVVALARRRAVGDRWWVLAAAGTLAITVTNWMVGLAAVVVSFPPRRAARIVAGAVATVFVLWGVEKVIFPGSRFPLARAGYERTFLYLPTPARIAQTAASFAVHTMVLPDVVRAPDPRVFRMPGAERSPPDAGQLVLQASWPGSHGLPSALAAAAWVGLLGLGFGSLGRSPWRDPLYKVVALSLAGQFALHLVYGEEAFLYSLHWLPMLLLVAVPALGGRTRRPALALCCVVVLAGGIANVRYFRALARVYGVDRPPAATSQLRRTPTRGPGVEAYRMLPASPAAGTAYGTGSHGHARGPA